MQPLILLWQLASLDVVWQPSSGTNVACTQSIVQLRSSQSAQGRDKSDRVSSATRAAVCTGQAGGCAAGVLRQWWRRPCWQPGEAARRLHCKPGPAAGRPQGQRRRCVSFSIRHPAHSLHSHHGRTACKVACTLQRRGPCISRRGRLLCMQGIPPELRRAHPAVRRE